MLGTPSERIWPVSLLLAGWRFVCCYLLRDFAPLITPGAATQLHYDHGLGGSPLPSSA